jgi:hypothetical protein
MRKVNHKSCITVFLHFKTKENAKFKLPLVSYFLRTDNPTIMNQKIYIIISFTYENLLRRKIAKGLP